MKLHTKAYIWGSRKIRNALREIRIMRNNRRIKQLHHLLGDNLLIRRTNGLDSNELQLIDLNRRIMYGTWKLEQQNTKDYKVILLPFELK